MRMALRHAGLLNTLWGKNVGYMTLSYCWTDEVKKNMLLKENKEQFFKSIPTNGWPQIYRDAVMMTGYFLVQYVWLDALCIVQDDPGDWETQAALMNIIYERGFSTLLRLWVKKNQAFRVFAIRGACMTAC